MKNLSDRKVIIKYRLFNKIIETTCSLEDNQEERVKRSLHVLAKPLSVIINTSLNQDIVPTMRKNAKVIPLFKGGSHLEMDIYRPISILPVLSKVMEKVVNVQLRQYLANNDVICNFQYGFRRYHSTESTALYLSDSIRRNADKGCITGALFNSVYRCEKSIRLSRSQPPACQIVRL